MVSIQPPAPSRSFQNQWKRSKRKQLPFSKIQTRSSYPQSAHKSICISERIWPTNGSSSILCSYARARSVPSTKRFSIWRWNYATRNITNDDFDTSSKQENDNESKTSTDPDLVEEEKTFPKKKGKPKETSINQKDLEAEQPNENQSRDISSKRFLPLFIHVLQFCYLCYKKKMPPVHYSVASTPSIDSWFNSLSVIKSNSNSFWYEKKLLHHHQLPWLRIINH